MPHRRLGKLTIAADEAEARPARSNRGACVRLGRRRRAGVARSRRRSPRSSRRSRARLRCSPPSSGIVDSHAFMLSLLADAEDHGAALARRAPADRIARWDGAWRVTVAGTELHAAIVVNAAGLDAWRVARTIEPLDPAQVPPRFLAKGSYFAYSGRVPFNRLIYPPPGGGRARHAPDARHRGAGALRPRRRVGRDDRLYGRPCAQAGLRCRDASVLARARSRSPRARIQRYPAETRRAGRARTRLHDRWRGSARPAGPRQPVRHRIAGPHRVARDRRIDRRARLRGVFRMSGVSTIKTI